MVAERLPEGAKQIATAKIQGPEARGNAVFWQLPNGRLRLTIDDYWVAPAPDPHIYLTARDDDVLDLNAALHLGDAPIHTDSYARDLVELSDLSAVKTLLVYCVEYSVYFGSGRVIPVTD